MLLGRAVAFMEEHRWAKTLDTGWLEWDMAVYCDSGLIVKVLTVQEGHGQGKRMIRVRFQMVPTPWLRVAAALSLVALAVVAIPYPRVALVAAAIVLALGIRAWVAGLRAAERVITVFAIQAREMHLIECSEAAKPQAPRSVFANRHSWARDRENDVLPGPNPEALEAHAPGTPVARFESVVTLEGLSPSEIEEQFA